MKKLIFLTVFCLSGVFVCQLHAQSLRNTSWKLFVAGEFNDSITLHIFSDSSMATNKEGSVLVRSLVTLSGDTITLKDYDGPYACLGMDGVYLIKMDNSHLILSMIKDLCSGRAQSIDGVKWIKAAGTTK